MTALHRLVQSLKIWNQPELLVLENKSVVIACDNQSIVVVSVGLIMEMYNYFNSLSQLHESFGSPSSPREIQTSLNQRSPASVQHDTSLTVSQPALTDHRVPGFATSMQDWTLAQKSRPKSAEVNRSKTDDANISRQSGK